EEAEEDDPEQQHHRVELEVAADFEDLGEDREQDREQHQGPDQRPEVAEHCAEVDALELGHRHQPEQVEEAPRAAAEGGGPAHLAQLGAARLQGAHRSAPRSTEVEIVWGRTTKPCDSLAPKTWKSSAFSTCRTIA